MAYAKGGLWLFSVLISPLQFTFTIKVTLSLIRPISFFFAPAKIVQDSDQKKQQMSGLDRMCHIPILPTHLSFCEKIY